MTDAKYPRPYGLQIDALYDAAWDLRDHRQTVIPAGENYEKWFYWLCRHEGFSADEIEVNNRTATGPIIIRYKD